MRSVKSSDEIEKIKSAQKIAEKAFDEILNFIKPGVTEREISLALDGQMLKNGAEALSFETIALCGSNTSMPHGVPSETAVKNGNFVLMDFGAVYDGYHSDMTRTVCVGEPSEKMVRVYDVVYEAQLKALCDCKSWNYRIGTRSFGKKVYRGRRLWRMFRSFARSRGWYGNTRASGCFV